jgi:hypothetical protein
MTAKDRVLQFIDLQGLSNRKFSEKILVSPLYFSKKGAMGSDILEKIAATFPDLNMDWILTGRGEMLLSNGDSTSLGNNQIDAAGTEDIMALDITTDNKILMLRDRIAMQAIEINMLKRLVDEYALKIGVKSTNTVNS